MDHSAVFGYHEHVCRTVDVLDLVSHVFLSRYWGAFPNHSPEHFCSQIQQKGFTARPASATRTSESVARSVQQFHWSPEYMSRVEGAAPVPKSAVRFVKPQRCANALHDQKNKQGRDSPALLCIRNLLCCQGAALDFLLLPLQYECAHVRSEWVVVHQCVEGACRALLIDNVVFINCRLETAMCNA